MKILLLMFVFNGFFAFETKAQYSSELDASYLAIVKAVADYKINDQEEIEKVEKLRNNERFNIKLNKMIDELDNSEYKNYKNKQVFDILLKAGKDIERVLNVN